MKVEYGIPTDKEGFRVQFGIQKGFFAKEGIELTTRCVFGGPEIAALFDSGELKIGQLGSPPATTALSKGARFKIVGSCVRQRALQYFVAHPSVVNWNELRGKSIGVLSRGSCSYWFARMVLARNGLEDAHDVSIKGLGASYADVTDLLASGEIQGAVVAEPNVSIGEHRGTLRILTALTDPEFCPTMQWGVIVANEGAMKREPQLVEAVLRGCRRSYQYAAEHSDELAEFCADLFKTDAQVMRRAIARETPDLRYDCQIDITGLQLAIELQRRLGAFTAPLRAEHLVEMRFLNNDVATSS